MVSIWEEVCQVRESFTIATGIILYNTCDGQLVSCLLHGSVRKRNQHGPGLAAGPWVGSCPLTPLSLCRFWISSGVTKGNSYKIWRLFGQHFPQFKVHEIMWVFICCLGDFWDFSPKWMISLLTLLCRIRTCVSLERHGLFGLSWRTMPWRGSYTCSKLVCTHFFE